jgi:hypothetical protein
MTGDARRVAALLLAALAGGCSALVTSAGEGDPAADVEAAWSIVDQRYPFLALKALDWDAVHADYRTRLAGAQGDDGLALVAALLGELRDGHVAVYSRGGGIPVFPYVPPRWVHDVPLYRPEVVRRYLPLRLAGADNLEYGVTADGVGYVYIANFSDGPWIWDFDAALDSLASARGLILDVRHNDGGSTNASNPMLGRFLSAPMAGPQFYVLGHDLPRGTLSPRGPFTWTKPVVVLLDGVSFSTAEIFAAVLGELPNVTLVGATTGGGGGGYAYFTLPSGARIRIPVQGVRRYDGVDVEWNGIPPDVEVLQDPRRLDRGEDVQLEAALQMLR